MQHIRRILALLLIFFGWKSSQSQPLPGSNQQTPATPKAAASPEASAPNRTAPPPQDPNLPPLAFAMKEYKMNADQEAKARALLEQALNSDKTRQAAAAPTALPAAQAKAAPVAASTSKSDDEAAREREIARIEAEVIKARQRREGQNPVTSSTAPAITSATPSAAPTRLPQQDGKAVMSTAQESQARTILNSDRPENRSRDEVPASNPALKSNLTYEQEKKARGMLRADFVVVGSDNPAPQTVPPPVKPTLPAPADASTSNLRPTQLPAPVNGAPQQAPAVTPSASVAPQPAPATSLPAPVQLAQVTPVKTVVAPAAPTQSTLTPDKEAQARELLRQTAVSLDPSATPANSAPAAPVVVPQAPLAETKVPAQTLPVASYKETAPVAPQLNTDQETRARQMLRGMLRDNRMDVVGTQPAATTEVAQPKPVTPPVASTAPVPAQPSVALQAPKPTPAPVVNPAAPASAQKLQPVETTTAAPVGSVVVMSPDQEAKARDMLKQVTGRSTYSPSPITTTAPVQPATPPPVAVAAPQATVVTPPPAAPATTTPALTAAPGGFTPEQEAKAREMLLQLHNQKPPANVVTTPTPAPITPAPAPITAPPAVAVNPPPASIPNISSVAPPATASGVTMTPDQEAKARALLTQVSGTVFTPENHPAQPYDAKRAAEDAKLRAKAEAQARKEMERMQADAKAKAREDLRKKTDAEARARKEAEETTAAIRNREKEEMRKRAQSEQGSGLVAVARPADRVPAETTPVRTAPAVSATQQTTAQAEAVSQSRTPAPAKTALRPEDDPSVPLAKRQRLRQLLDDYMRDRITPAEYHTARAKIITEQ